MIRAIGSVILPPLGRRHARPNVRTGYARHVRDLDATNLYLGMTGTDLANGDMVVYFDIKENNGSTDGDTRGEAGKVAHGLPFPANYAFWAESGADSRTMGMPPGPMAQGGLGFQGWSDTPCAGMDADLDSTVNDVSEVKIPWTCLGNPLGEVRIATIIEAESTGSVLAVHPTQTIDSGSVQQNFTEFLQFTPQLQGDLSDGTLTSFPIIYRTYLGNERLRSSEGLRRDRQGGRR